MKFIRTCQFCGRDSNHSNQKSLTNAINANRQCRSCSKIGKTAGEKNGMFGKPRTDAVKKAISEKLTGRKIPREIVEKVTKKLIGKKRSDESKKRYSAAALKRMANGWNPRIMTGGETGIERKIRKLLEDLHYSFIYEYKIENRFYDFYLPDYKILIECDGNYWHGKDLEDSELNTIQVDRRKSDRIKNQLAIDNKIKLFRFWEDEINNDIERIRNILQEFIQNESD